MVISAKKTPIVAKMETAEIWKLDILAHNLLGTYTYKNFKAHFQSYCLDKKKAEVPWQQIYAVLYSYIQFKGTY